ncbi:hypothetical protein OIU91_04850 [Streptomyces sp. NBC_01456]|uniref:hypothetical protein n=1 Tax=unclassified Streptomyces TaxID=2593676 RepID=UPI002E2EABB4|nr:MULTISPECIES: hypothetical protein [unclassified Streptomyces]
MADEIVWASELRAGYRLDRTLDLVEPWLEDVRQLAARTAAVASPPASFDVNALAQEVALAQVRLQPSCPHEAQAHSRFGDLDCAFELLSLLQYTDRPDPHEPFAGVVPDLSGHLAAQIGHPLGITQVMRGLSTIVGMLSGMGKDFLEDPDFLRRARKLILIYGIPADLFGDVVGGLISADRGGGAHGVPPLPISQAGLYVWARAAQYMADEAEIEAGLLTTRPSSPPAVRRKSA